MKRDELELFISKRIKEYDPSKKETQLGSAQAAQYAKILVEDRKIDADLEKQAKELEFSREKLEKEQSREDARENKRLIGNVISIVGGVAGAAATIFSAVSMANTAKLQIEAQNRRFDQACKREENEPFLGLAETTTVRDGLSSRR